MHDKTSYWYDPVQNSPAPYSQTDFKNYDSIIKKIINLIFHPQNFFKALPEEEKKGNALLIAIISGSLGMAAFIFWQGLFDLVLISESTDGSVSSWGYTVMILIGSFFFPMVVIFQQFFLSALIHLSLKLIKGGRLSFRQTFVIIAYGQAPLIWGIIPLIGGSLGLVWSVVVQIIGIKSVHRLSLGKSLLVFFLPVALIFVAFIILGVALSIVLE